MLTRHPNIVIAEPPPRSPKRPKAAGAAGPKLTAIVRPRPRSEPEADLSRADAADRLFQAMARQVSRGS